MDIVVWIFLKVVHCRQKPKKLLVYVISNEDSNGTTFIEKPLCNRKLQSDKWSVVQTRKIKIRRKMKSTLFSPNFSVIFSNPFVLSAKRRECFLLLHTSYLRVTSLHLGDSNTKKRKKRKNIVKHPKYDP